MKAFSENLLVPSTSALALTKLGSRTGLDKLARAFEKRAEPLATTWPPDKDGNVSSSPTPGAELIAALEALAARHGLAPIPEEKRSSCKDWSAWLSANRSAFPERLPGVGVLPAPR